MDVVTYIEQRLHILLGEPHTCMCNNSEYEHRVLTLLDVWLVSKGVGVKFATGALGSKHITAESDEAITTRFRVFKQRQPWTSSAACLKAFWAELRLELATAA